MRIQTHIHACVYMHIYVYTSIHVYMHTHVYIRVYSIHDVTDNKHYLENKFKHKEITKTQEEKQTNVSDIKKNDTNLHLY